MALRMFATSLVDASYLLLNNLNTFLRFKDFVAKMVFQTAALFIRSRGPDAFWRKRRIFKLSAVNGVPDKWNILHYYLILILFVMKHFTGRKRNCYSIAIRYVHRALAYAFKSRQLKKEDMANVIIWFYLCLFLNFSLYWCFLWVVVDDSCSCRMWRTWSTLPFV